MTYINTLNGINSLGSLSNDLNNLITANESSINNVLNRAKQLNGLGKIAKYKNVLSSDEVINRYNAGISEEEIQAWVWYRRSLGIPMQGWEKYYIDSKDKSKSSIEDMLVTTHTTVIKDTAWRDLKTLPVGVLLGKRVGKKEHKSNDNNNYIFYRDNDGIKIVRKDHVKVNKSAMITDRSELLRLVKAGALYYLNGELLPYPVYSYANMYDRELQLREDKDFIIKEYGQKVYDKHIEVINDKKPKMLSILNPLENERQQILAISEYAQEFIVNELKEDSGVVLDEPVSLFEAYIKYLRSLDRNEIEDVGPTDIIIYYLRGKNLPRDMEKDVKAEFRSNIRIRGEEVFKKFLHNALSFQDQQRLDFDWNRKYNGQSSVAHKRIPIGFKMSSKFKGFDMEIRPAQREGIAFMELVGSGIIAYDVGVGKTITAIIELANALNSGKCKRPLVVVPKPTYKNWLLEIIGDGKGNAGVLTGTGVTINDWAGLPKASLSRLPLNKAVAEKSITVVTYEGLNKIGFGEKMANELFDELITILNQDDGNDSERAEAQSREKLWKEIGIGLKDTVADIEVLGFDYMVIDEAHNFKNVFSRVSKGKDGRKRFGSTGSDSMRAKKLFLLDNYIQRKYGKNVMLLTATPFTNSPLEVFSMLSHVAYQGLRDMGYLNVKSFFEQFVLETSEMVVNTKGDLQMKDVVKSFNNRLVLQKLIYNHINYKTGDEAGVKRPCKINLPKLSERKADGTVKRLAPKNQKLTYLRMTDRQMQNQNDIKVFANAASKKRGGGDILKAMNMSLNNALSPYLYDREEVSDYQEFVEESPKIHYTCEAIRTVRDYHLKNNEPISGQVIYMNRGKDYFPLIKEYLIKDVGYKEVVKYNGKKLSEVEVIASGISDSKKEAIKEAFNDGVVKIIIGTATIREGINLQKNGTVVYNLYPDWNPTDLQQLEGRVWRQGNKFGYVRIVLPLVQDSMDVFVFQKIEEKTSRINDIWYKGDRGNVLSLDSLDPEEVKYALLTDVEAIAKTVIKKDVKTQQRKIEGIKYNVEKLREFANTYNILKRNRKNLKDSIDTFMRKFSQFDYIAKEPTKKELKNFDADKRKKVLSHIEKYKVLTDILAKVPTEDKDLIKVARSLNYIVSNFPTYNTNYFADNLSRVKKAERTILAPKGFSIDDDISKVIAEYEKDLEKENKDLVFYNSKEHWENVLNEVILKKSALKIDGKSIYDRVKEFADLNYLLSYKFVDTKIDTCPIPTKGKRKVAQQTDENEVMALAIALEVELKLITL